MSLTIGSLTGLINADDSGMRSGLSAAELRMRGFQRDVEGRLRHLDGTFATSGQLMAAGLSAGSDEGDRLGLSLGRLGGMAGGLGKIAMSVGGMAAKLGAAAPAAAGLAAAVANIAPASGVAVTALLAIKQAQMVVKLGTQGMGDALSNALDPANAEKFEEAIKKLSPSAQAFARQVKALAPEWNAFQQGIQQELFRGLGENLKRTATSVMPVLKTELKGTATALGDMAAGVMGAARGLADSGTLGTAMRSATNGLKNMQGVPGMVVTGLGQIAAAAGPSFEKLTGAAADGLAGVSQSLGAAFESGAMQKAIEQAITLIGQLMDVAGNVGSIIGSVFSAAQVSGGGFIGVLQEITGALATAFASPEVQGGLRAIFETMATVAKTVAPLLVSALKVIGPVFEQLGPPIQTLVQALGTALAPVIEALGPVLGAAASAIGALITAAAPILPLIGTLVAALLPAVTPLFAALEKVFVALAPVIQQVVGILADTLTPIIAALIPIVEILAASIGDQLVLFVGMLGDLLVELGPTLVTIGQTFGDLLIALTPVIAEIAALGLELMTSLMPLLTPLIELIAQLVAIFADELAVVIETVVVPALEMIAALLRGDFDEAWKKAKELMRGAVDTIVRWFTEFPGKVHSALASFGSKLGERVRGAGEEMKKALAAKIAESVTKAREFPGKVRSALGDLGSKLRDAGRSLIAGFISGMLSKLGDVGGAASKLVSKARDFFPFSPAKEGPFAGRGWTLYSGQSVAQALAAGMTSGTGLVGKAASGMLAHAQQQIGAGLHLGAGLPALGLAGGPAMAGAGSGPPRIVLEVRGDGTTWSSFLAEQIRDQVTIKGGGDVQRAFGQRR
ncbi:hypothetical protein [Streptomyces albipurpureus]|uniref:Phage tail protein n=1 Tax=Streptomyces albipurpureus TaxID=2897419 RepID=A0ABT0V0X6_9ACTN|nr:hypothetical protein [Streptomyces sp. CWNU-1]MCM2394364.1 hypothetical protein [Streptomyces sp. CWNU-1]